MVFGVFLLHTPAVLAAAGAAPQADAAFDSAQSLPLTDLQGRTEVGGRPCLPETSRSWLTASHGWFAVG